MRLIIDNKEKNIYICNSFKTRFLGLMGKTNISDIYVFPKCNSIHTFFMKEDIDVVMLDKNGKILKIYNNLQPWKVILPKKNVYYTIELPKNTLKEKKLHFIV